MSDEKVLTKEIAKQSLAARSSVNLGEFTAIEDAAAEILGTDWGLWLSLYGLTELSDAAVESLSKHEGDLDLSSLTELSDAAAESLSRHKGDLWLSDLTELSESVADILREHLSFADED